MPEHVHVFEKYQHIGLAVGSIEFFLKENGIDYAVNKDDIENSVLITINRVEKEYVGIEKQEILKHAQRSFDTESTVDADTQTAISTMIDEFLSEDQGYKIMLTDPVVRKKINALAIYWKTAGDKNGNVRAPQMTAPLLISVPPKEYDISYWMDMGRLYANIGLEAIARGYRVAYCNAFNYFDPRLKRVEQELHLKFGEYTETNFVPRPWICVGTPFDADKPWNWLSVPNKFKNGLMTSCILTTKEFLKIQRETETENV
jgi:hypothetical protein